MAGIDFSKFSQDFKAKFEKAIADKKICAEEFQGFSAEDQAELSRQLASTPGHIGDIIVIQNAYESKQGTLEFYAGASSQEGKIELSQDTISKYPNAGKFGNFNKGVVTILDKDGKVLKDSLGNPIKFDFSTDLEIDSTVDNIQGGFETIEGENFQRTNRRFAIALIRSMYDKVIVENQKMLEQLGLLNASLWREGLGMGIQKIADSINADQKAITATTAKKIEQMVEERDKICNALEKQLDNPSGFSDEFSKLVGSNFSDMNFDKLRETCHNKENEKDDTIRYNKTVEDFNEMYPDNKVTKYLEGNFVTKSLDKMVKLCDSVADILVMFWTTGGIGGTLGKASMKGFANSSKFFIENIGKKNYKEAIAQLPKLSSFMAGAAHSAPTMSTFEGGKAFINSATNGEDLTADEILSRTIDGFIGGAEMGVEMAGLQAFAIAPIMNKLSPVLGKMTGASSKIKELLKKNGEMSLEDISKVYDDCIQTTRGIFAQEGLHIGVSLPIMVPGFTGIDSAKAFLSNGDNSYKEDEFREQLLKEAKTQEERVRISAMNSFELKVEFVKRNFQAQLEGMTTIEGVSLALRRFQAARLAGQAVPKPVNNLLGAKIKTVEKDGKPLYEVVQENGKTLKFDMGKGGNVSQFSSPERAIAAYQAMCVKIVSEFKAELEKADNIPNYLCEVDKYTRDAKINQANYQPGKSGLVAKKALSQPKVQQNVTRYLDNLLESNPEILKNTKSNGDIKNDKDYILPDGTVVSLKMNSAGEMFWNEKTQKYDVNFNSNPEIILWVKDTKGEEHIIPSFSEGNKARAQKILDYMSTLTAVPRDKIAEVQQITINARQEKIKTTKADNTPHPNPSWLSTINESTASAKQNASALCRQSALPQGAREESGVHASEVDNFLPETTLFDRLEEARDPNILTRKGRIAIGNLPEEKREVKLCLKVLEKSINNFNTNISVKDIQIPNDFYENVIYNKYTTLTASTFVLKDGTAIGFNQIVGGYNKNECYREVVMLSKTGNKYKLILTDKEDVAKYDKIIYALYKNNCLAVGSSLEEVAEVQKQLANGVKYETLQAQSNVNLEFDILRGLLLDESQFESSLTTLKKNRLKKFDNLKNRFNQALQKNKITKAEYNTLNIRLNSLAPDLAKISYVKDLKNTETTIASSQNKLLSPETKAQVKDAVQNIRNNYRASFDQIKADLKAMGLDDIGNMSIRLKGEQSLYDKIANYMLEHKGATLEDAIKDVRDAIGARTVVESGKFANHPEVKALLDAGKEREAMLRAAELQSEPAVESLKSEILKQEQNNNHLVTARISNYVSPDGIPYLSENQLADLKQFAANHGVKLKINLRIDPSDPNFSKIDENYKPTTKSQPSGYTALQVNFITKDGKIIEWQFRGDKVNEFAEGEHIPYDLRTGKNIIGEHKELEELYNPFIDMLSEKNMNKETYKEYNRYLSDYYTHLRKLELGFDSVEPKLEDYGKGFKFDERLSAKNLIVLHETAEKIKNKVLSVKDAMDEYNKKVAQNK